MLSKISDYVDFKSINSSVKYLSISALFTGIALGYFFTLIVILAKYRGYTEGAIGIIAACFSLGLMSAGFIVSNILDKIGLYKTMSLAILIQTICVILMFSFFNPLNLAINHFIMGIFGGMIWMTMDTWVNVVSDNKTRGKAIGFYTSMNGNFLSVIGSGTRISTNPLLTKKLSAYTNFLLSKERAGIERAVGSGTLAKNEFGNGMRIKFNNLVNTQKTYMYTFTKFADEKTMKFYKSTVQGAEVEEVEEDVEVPFSIY